MNVATWVREWARANGLESKKDNPSVYVWTKEGPPRLSNQKKNIIVGLEWLRETLKTTSMLGMTKARLTGEPMRYSGAPESMMRWPVDPSDPKPRREGDLAL